MNCMALGNYCSLRNDYLLQIAAVMKIGLITASPGPDY
jgi:hypothetical protein